MADVYVFTRTTLYKYARGLLSLCIYGKKNPSGPRRVM